MGIFGALEALPGSGLTDVIGIADAMSVVQAGYARLGGILALDIADLLRQVR